MTAVSGESKPVRPRRRWLWTMGRAIAAGPVLILVAALSAILSPLVTNHQVKSALAKIRAEGAPVTIAQATPPPIPMEQNAAPLYLEAYEIVKPHTFNSKTQPSPTGTGYIRSAGQPLGYGGADWSNPEDVKGLAELLKQDVRALELLDRAAQMPGCRFDVQWSEGWNANFPHLGKLRYLRFFCSDALAVAAVQGDTAAVARRLRDGVALVRHVSREPASNSQMVAATLAAVNSRAIEFALSRCAISEQDARAVLALVESMDLRADLIRALKTNRARTLDAYAKTRQHPAYFREVSDTAADKEDGDEWIRCYVRQVPLFNRDELAYLACAARELHAVQQPWAQAKREFEDLEHWTRRHFRMTPLAITFAAVTSQGLHQHCVEAQTRLNLLSATLGLSVYKQHFGTYPASLSELSRINWPVPQDPYTNGPLRYKRTGDRYALYSIGPDGVDDGGKPTWYWALSQKGAGPSEDDRNKGDMPWQWR
jgi:hypothetical protein